MIFYKVNLPPPDALAPGETTVVEWLKPFFDENGEYDSLEVYFTEEKRMSARSLLNLFDVLRNSESMESLTLLDELCKTPLIKLTHNYQKYNATSLYEYITDWITDRIRLELRCYGTPDVEVYTYMRTINAKIAMLPKDELEQLAGVLSRMTSHGVVEQTPAVLTAFEKELVKFEK